MAYSIIGVKSQPTMGKIGIAGMHNERELETRNADPTRSPMNERIIGSGDLCADVQARLDDAGITRVRANGVRAVEHYLTASPEWFAEASPQDVRAWVDTSVAWLKERYGDNLVAVHLHMDETSPNIHAFMVPITQDGRLSKTDYFDGPEKLRAMHTSYNEAVRHLGLERGIEGSRAKHTDLKHWHAMIPEPTRDAWEMARTITIAPRPGQDLGQHVAEAVAPVIEAEKMKAHYWKERAEQTQRQLDGTRQRQAEREMRYEQFGQVVNRVRDTPLEEVLQGLGATKGVDHDTHKWSLNGKEITVRGEKYADMRMPQGTPLARSGGAIDLVQYATGQTFKEAVEYLNDRHYGGHAVSAPYHEQRVAAPEQEQRGPVVLPPIREDRWLEARHYLVEGRGLPAQLVDEAHARGDVYATAHAKGYTNAVFVRRDDDGQAVSAFIRGTRGRYMQSTERVGSFSVQFGTPNRIEKPGLVIVESPIDALSYAALHTKGLAYGRVLSTDGNGPLPTREIDQVLAQGGKVRAGFDNDGPDGAGAKLWAKLCERYPRETSGDFTPLRRELPKAKDWNEDLQRLRAQEQARGMGMER